MRSWKTILDRVALFDSERLFSYLDIDSEGYRPAWAVAASNRSAALLNLEFDLDWITALRERPTPAPEGVIDTIARHVALSLAPLSTSPSDLYAFERTQEEIKNAFLSRGLGAMAQAMELRAENLEQEVAEDLSAWRRTSL